MAPKKKERKRGKKEGGKLGGSEERKEEKEQNSKVKNDREGFSESPSQGAAAKLSACPGNI